MIEIRHQKSDFHDSILSLGRHLLNGDSAALANLFEIEGYAPPTIIWTPSSRSFLHPTMLAFSCSVGSALSEDGILRERNFSFATFEAYSDYLMILEPTNLPTKWTYTYYGQRIASQFGKSMVGKSTDMFEDHISAFFSALYYAAKQKRSCVLSEHGPPKAVFVSKWRRLIVPVFQDDERLSRFIVLNIPDNELRAGLEAVPTPVVVARADGSICFANNAMEELIGEKEDKLGKNIQDVLGLDIPTTDLNRPETFLELRTSKSKMCILGRMFIEISATFKPVFFRDQLLYVIAVEPHL